eukprot:jgi/Mesvir1/6949/Mv09099-RA.1
MPLRAGRPVSGMSSYDGSGRTMLPTSPPPSMAYQGTVDDGGLVAAQPLPGPGEPGGPEIVPTVAAIVSAEAAISSMARRAVNDGPLPFGNTRLRTFHQNVQHRMAGNMGFDALSPKGADQVIHIPAPSPSFGTSSSELFASGGRASMGGATTVADESMRQALAEIEGLKAEIMRVEGTLGTLKSASTGSPRFPTGTRRKGLGALDTMRKATSLSSKKGADDPSLPALSLSGPVSRGESVVLEQTLDELLPQGRISEALRVGERGDVVFHRGMLQREFELVDIVQHEAARQVHTSCAERGNLLEKLRGRYAEFFSALSEVLVRLQAAYSRAMADLAELREESKQAKKREEHLEEEAAMHRTENQFLESRVEELQQQCKAQRQEMEARLVAVGSEKQMLAYEVAHYEEKLAQVYAEKEAAVASSTAHLEEDLAAVVDERDDILQRFKFLERQMAKLREEKRCAMPTEHESTQTDGALLHLHEREGHGVDHGKDHHAEDDEDFDAEENEGSLDDHGKKHKKKKKKKKKGMSHDANKLGGFADMVAIARMGRVKPRAWVMKCVAQIAADKILADNSDDKEGAKRQHLVDYVYDWHLNRYGLRHLAETNLLDLVTSVRHYHKENVKLRLFAQMCGLFDEAPARQDFVDFFLFVLQTIAGRESVMNLFPENDTYWLKPAFCMDVVKACFANLADPVVLKQFMQLRIEPLMDAVTKKIDMDAFLLVVIEERQRRVERTLASLKAMFHAGDKDGDGFLVFSEFVATVKLVAPQMEEKEVVRFYREALEESADTENVDAAAFMCVMQANNFHLPPGVGPSKLTVRPPDEAGADGSNENQFEMLEEAVKMPQGNPAELYASLAEKLAGDSPEVLLALDLRVQEFQQFFEARHDAKGAWASYRNLMGELNSALQHYKTGHRAPNLRSGTADDAATSHKSLQQITSEASAVGGREGGSLSPRVIQSSRGLLKDVSRLAARTDAPTSVVNMIDMVKLHSPHSPRHSVKQATTPGGVRDTGHSAQGGQGGEVEGAADAPSASPGRKPDTGKTAFGLLKGTSPRVP